MKTILFADDDRNICEFCRRELEEEGYRVMVVYDGAAAVASVSQGAPDLVILDISMPGLNGLEATERIRVINADVPVILFTSFHESCLGDRRSSLATACVEKCEDLSELKRAIVRSLKSPRESESLHLGLPPAPA